jgi:protein disulfide-isomerase
MYIMALACAVSALPFHGYRDAMKQAKEKDKQVFVYFGAGWCEPCKEMRANVLVDKGVKEKLDRYIMSYVDVDKDPRTAKAHKVRTLPAYMIVDKNGKTIKASSGYKSAPEFLEWLQKLEPEKPKPPIAEGWSTFLSWAHRHWRQPS